MGTGVQGSGLGLSRGEGRGGGKQGMTGGRFVLCSLWSPPGGPLTAHQLINQEKNRIFMLDRAKLTGLQG